MATLHPSQKESEDGARGGADSKHLEIVAVLDSAARARATHYTPQTDEERALDKRVNRKLDWIVLSLLAVEFIFCGIDKTNVGFVATSSFVQDANLKPDDIPNSLSLFSATYVPLQPIMVILARRVGVKYFITLQLITWGGLCMAHAGVRGSGSLVALRLLIGAAEAGFTQIGMYYMSTLYPKYSVGLRAGLFTGMYSIAGAFAGLIAYGLLRIDGGAVKGWQAVFLLEGGFTVFLGVLSFFVLPRDLATAWFLSPEERGHAVRRMELDQAGSQEASDGEEGGEAGVTDQQTSRQGTRIGGSVTKRDLMDVFTDWKKLLTVVCNIAIVLPVTAFTTFLPLIVKGMGYEGITASLMSVPPFVVGVIGLIAIVYSSDHFRERSLHTVFGVALGLVGCIVMAASADTKLRYGFTHVCMAGVFVGGPLIAVWLAGNTPWKGARSVVLGVNGWSNLAGVIAGQIYKSRYAPRYETPLIITMALMASGATGLVFIRYLYTLENKKRAALIAGWDEQQFADEAMSTERRGDQRRTFMYGL